jgi:hypothetical protein
VKKEHEPSVEMKTEAAVKQEDITKSPAMPSPAPEEPPQKETTPKKEKDQDKKVINIQIRKNAVI